VNTGSRDHEDEGVPVSTVHESREPTLRTPTTEDYLAVRESEEFQSLRRRFRRFVFPATALGLAWYFVYVLLADYAHDVMATKLVGNITVGLVLGLSQFVVTFLITTLYVRFADRELDPRAEVLRQRLEGDVR
jgi:uncharacterized membrane protein (DUF485 family)